MSKRLTKKEIEKKLKEEKTKVKELVKEMEKLKKEKEEYLSLLQRVTADFDNYKKRTLQREEDTKKFAGEDFFRSLLPLVDDIERTVNHMKGKSSLKDVKVGIEMVHKKFQEFLRAHNVERIKAVGKEFNPHYHEALLVEGKGDGKEIVSEEMEAGYFFHGKLLRPARVKVKKLKEGMKNEA